jgi:hypothetical protein
MVHKGTALEIQSMDSINPTFLGTCYVLCNGVYTPLGETEAR